MPCYYQATIVIKEGKVRNLKVVKDPTKWTDPEITVRIDTGMGVKRYGNEERKKKDGKDDKIWRE